MFHHGHSVVRVKAIANSQANNLWGIHGTAGFFSEIKLHPSGFCLLIQRLLRPFSCAEVFLRSTSRTDHNTCSFLNTIGYSELHTHAAWEHFLQHSSPTLATEKKQMPKRPKKFKLFSEWTKLCLFFITIFIYFFAIKLTPSKYWKS